MHYVPAIEPGLAFWRDRLGFAATAEMPGEHALVFVILAGERIADRAWLEPAPHAGGMDWRGHCSAPFVEVDDIRRAGRCAGLRGGGAEARGTRPSTAPVTFARFARG